MGRLAWSSLALAACLLLGSACGDDGGVREWRPEDHSQPEAAEVDPSRRPGGGDGAAGTSEERAVAALWTVSCASCHGTEGRGDGPGKPPNADVRDLTDPEWQASVTDEQIADVIVTGRGLMPGFGDRINERGVTGLVRHVRRLGGAE